MGEASLLGRFLRGEIDNRTFRHADHVRVGFALLDAHDFPAASHKFSKGLRAIAARAGNLGAYHETITLAFLALIAERRATGCFENAEDFISSKPDVLDKTILNRWHSPERLQSDLARRVFVLPEAVR
jgi:hypothetical protein